MGNYMPTNRGQSIDDSFSTTLQISSGETIRIVAEEDLSRVTAFNADEEEIGHFEFEPIEQDEHLHDYYKLVWAYLDCLSDQYKRQGIGRAMLKLWCDISGEQAAVERNTGVANSQGGHLTGDAPGFVARMVEAGYLAYERG